MIITVLQHGNVLYDVNILDEDIQNGLEILIGREEDCHIQLDSFMISRYHARVYLDGVVKFEVTSDYGGVSKNGAEIRKIDLIENDRIQISEFELVFSNIGQYRESPANQEPKMADEVDRSDIVTELQPAEELYDSQTQQIAKIQNETIQIPSELEDMMAETSPQVDDLSETLTPDAATEMFSEDMGETEMLQDQFEDDLDVLDSPIEDQSLDDDLGYSEESLGDEFSSDPVAEEIDESADDFSSDNEFNQDNAEENSFEDQSEVTDFDNNEGFEDSGFDQGEDSFGDDGGFGDSDAGTGSTQVFQSFAKFRLKLFGEYAPFDSYLIGDTETKIGRDPEQCQIVLNDPEVSKVHAIIKKTLVNCMVVDNDSSNGIIWNGERTQKAELTNGDEFIIGDTTFTVEVISDIIEAEKDVLMPVEEGQEVEIEEIVEEEVDFDDFEGGEGFGEEEEVEKSFIKRIWKDKRKRLYLIVAGVLLLLFMLPENKPKKPKVVEEGPKKDQQQKEKDKKQFTAETLEKLEQNYALALAKFEAGEYSEAKEYIDIVMSVDPEYKDTPTLSKLIDEGIAELERIAKEKALEEERLQRQVRVNELVEKAKSAVKDKNIMLARELFNQILELDPENLDVPPLKLEIDAYEAEVARKKEEEARAKARRQAMLDKLKPGKSAYLQEEWYQAAEKLDKFIKEKDIDEDLLKEASQMLKDSKQKLASMLTPLISKARSFKEGQDLKQAYETYGEVLKLDPTNEEALNQRDAIFTILYTRSKKVYREALIAESLSLFSKAKEKFQEVQQISPLNSEYYNKATDKLKSYLE